MDIDLIRKETKGCSDKIFLNSAGSSLVPDVVLDKMISYLRQEAVIGGYTLSNQSADEIHELYVQAAILLNCSPENIAYTSSATDAYAKAITAVNFKQGDVILTTDDDYISNQLSFLSLKDRFGIKIVRADNLSNGNLDLESFERLVIRHEPKLVALTHIPTNSGLVQPAAEVGAICRKYNILYLLDACQSVGQMLVDVKKTGCDFLTATGRKFIRGPRGTGFLYVSDRVLATDMAPLVFDNNGASWTGTDEYKLEATAKRFEFFEASMAGKLGMASALKYINDIGISNIEKYNMELMQNFRAGLAQVEGLQLHDHGSQLSNILTFTTSNRPLEETAKLLSENRVYFSMSFRNLALIDFNKKDLDAVIRFSPHYFNTIQELEKITDILTY
jgi:cysteine desulfurase/selenocysteine lyase